MEKEEENLMFKLAVTLGLLVAFGGSASARNRLTHSPIVNKPDMPELMAADFGSCRVLYSTEFITSKQADMLMEKELKPHADCWRSKSLGITQRYLFDLGDVMGYTRTLPEPSAATDDEFIGAAKERATALSKLFGKPFQIMFYQRPTAGKPKKLALLVRSE